MLSSIVEGDGEVGEASVILLVSRWALCKPIVAVVVVINPLLECSDVGLESLHLLSVDVISNLDGGGKSIDDGPVLVSRRVRSGSEDVLYGGGG